MDVNIELANVVVNKRIILYADISKYIPESAIYVNMEDVSGTIRDGKVEIEFSIQYEREDDEN